MNDLQEGISAQATAVLHEILQALATLTDTGTPHTLFIDKMALTAKDRQDIRDYLGPGGNVRIRLEACSEPAEWLESGVSGVWYGVFYNQTGQPILETVEITLYPGLAAAQREDVALGVAALRQRLTPA